MAMVRRYGTAGIKDGETEGYTCGLRLINIRVTPLSDREVAMLTADAIRSDRRIVIADQNLHGVYLSTRNPAMRALHESAPYVYIDGMGLVLLGNLLGIRLRRIHRATSLDFMPILLPLIVQEGWRLFYLGGRREVAVAGADAIRKEYPGLQLRSHHGYLSENTTTEVIREINEYRPHILMVGMGMPLQETWIQQNQKKIDANVIIPVGAYIDYKANAVPTAPRWLASFCLEWMYRLATEPRRLWYRYLVEPWIVMAELISYSLQNGCLTDIGLPEPLCLPNDERALAKKVLARLPSCPPPGSPVLGLSAVESAHLTEASPQ